MSTTDRNQQSAGKGAACIATAHDRIIDAHLHLPADYPGLSAKRKALLSELERNGVSGGIVIADSELESVIGSVSECADLFRGDRVIRVVAGISPFISYPEQLTLCRELLESGDIIGLKLYTGHESFFCTDPRLCPVFALAEEFSVPVLFHTGWDHAQYAAPPEMKKLARLYPRIRFVYCHCFYPEAAQCFEILGECENVFFDISSVADDPEKLPQIAQVLNAAVPAMPHRFLFGSDFGSCSQRAHLDFAAGLTLTPQQRECLMYQNACAVYHLPAAES